MHSDVLPMQLCMARTRYILAMFFQCRPGLWNLHSVVTGLQTQVAKPIGFSDNSTGGV
jgi:hypothetical protein